MGINEDAAIYLASNKVTVVYGDMYKKEWRGRRKLCAITAEIIECR